MSLINQALQKAQREQLAQQEQSVPSFLRPATSRAARHRLRWWLGGLSGLLVLGAGLYVWHPTLLQSFWEMRPRVASTPTPTPEVLATVPQPPPPPRQSLPEARGTIPEPAVVAPAVPPTVAAPATVPTPVDAAPPRPALPPAPPPGAMPPAVPRIAVVPLLPTQASEPPASPPGPALALTPPTGPAALAVPPVETSARVEIQTAAVPPGEAAIRPGKREAVPPTPDSRPRAPGVVTVGAEALRVADVAKAQELIQRASAAQADGHLKRAATLFTQAVKLDPTSKAAYNSLGNVYFQQKRYHQALEMYQRALTLDPLYAKARNNLGNTYMRLAMYDRALAELHQALQADDSYSLTHYNLACVYARTGDSAKAAQYLQDAMALDPDARTWALTDADFAPVRTAPEVRQLLETSP